MEEKDLCKYVDVFYGNGETDRFFEDGLASKWFYIKALCGNTFPHAVLPFGKISVGPYSGGYSTGYGTHMPNSCGGIEKFSNKHSVRGFSHLHQSGVGGIKYYYNYLLTSPIYGGIEGAFDFHELKCEEARPGYYSAKLDDIACEFTVDGCVALHRYRFNKDGGRVVVDFSNDGLNKDFSPAFYGIVKNEKIKKISDSEVGFFGEFSGVDLYFCVKSFGVDIKAEISKIRGKNLAVFDFEGKDVNLKVSYSTISLEDARANVASNVKDFEQATNDAYDVWNKHLSAIRIETENKALKEKFYSNLYHSLIKPVDMQGENVLGVKGDVVVDFATFWDQYKTALPLIYACYSDMGEKIVKGIENISKTFGKIPCSFGLSNVFPCEEQAKMLGVLSLLDAYHMGVSGATVEAIEGCTERELCREDYKSFLTEGVFERYTHILDVTDACFAVAEITNKPELRKKLLTLADKWQNAYDEDGLLSKKSPYYEGDRYTYSFRIQKNMRERVALAGGKEKFLIFLDNFFGFSGESVKQLNHIGADKEIQEAAYHRFEGFNNECDMEAPYAYIYADRHDRLSEIIKECVSRSFGLGKGALPGNNDSGGLSSLFVWNVIGIFPVSGSGEFLVGAPPIDKAEITLHNGKLLKIIVDGSDKTYVDRVELNGEKLLEYKIPMHLLMQGGELHFYKK